MSYIAWPEPDDAATAPPPPAPPALNKRLPLYYALAVVMVIAGCTGPSWFRLMGPGPSGVTKSFYRMFLTALLQGPLALLLEGRACDGPRARAWAYKAATIITPFGVAMGLHFASVATSITSTSFLHSMAYVNLSPLFFCALVLLRCAVSRAAWRGVSAPAPAPAPFFHPTRSPAPHVLEMLGAVLAFSGVVALAALDGGAATGAGDLPVTAAGDAAGIFASLFMALYLMGSTRRGDMKLLSWMFPLHCVAAVVTGLLAMAGGATLDSGPSGLFLFAADGRVFLATLGSVALPSFICHTLANGSPAAAACPPFW